MVINKTITNDKEKIKEILTDSINSFEHIDKYKMVGIFGSIIHEGGKLGDVDLVSFSDGSFHEKFRGHLTKEFKKKGIKLIFFETVTRMPKKNKGELLIHDHLYYDLNYFLENQWNVLINVMIKDLITLHGKNIIKDLPQQKISKKDLFLPFIKWIDTINNIKKYNKFKNYILSHLSENFYDSGFKKEGIEIILNSNTNWKTNLNKIKKVLKTSL